MYILPKLESIKHDTEEKEKKCIQVLKSDVHNSFKFIVNPCRKTTEIEITSLLQYCALKNILSKFILNNIKSLKCNKNPIRFGDEVTNVYPDASFTKYVQMPQSERDSFKTKISMEFSNTLFFDALSKKECLDFFKEQKYLEQEYRDTVQDHYIVDHLYTFFMNNYRSHKYLSEYETKHPYYICYVEIPKIVDKDIDICYDDGCIHFDIINSEHNDKEDIEEFIRLINCINESIELQILKNNGHIENTYDELCVYTKDPTVIHDVLERNQLTIRDIKYNIDSLNYKPHEKYSHVFDISNELHTSIANVINTCETRKKKAEDSLTVLKGLF